MKNINWQGGLLFLLSTIIAPSIKAQDMQPQPVMIKPDMIIRLSEIEIIPKYLDEYQSILKEEAEASLAKEPGVIAIFPMTQKAHPEQIRIVEIYADKAAYEKHLQTPHFKKYKSTTLEMVKNLRLVDMQSLDVENMRSIFRKL